LNHPANGKSHFFSSRKHKVVVKTTKYSVFKGELLNQSFHDALSTSALFFAGKTSESNLKAHAVKCD